MNRTSTTLTLAACLALLGGCGGRSGSGSGSVGGTQTLLRVTTLGNGLVRGAGTDCRGACTTLLPIGSEVHLQAVPDPGASFVAWTGACNGAGACQLTLNSETAVTASFNRPPVPPGFHHLTVVVDGTGRVVSTPAGLDCDSTTCSADFNDGATVALNATPAAGFTFNGWSGGSCTGTAGCSITLHADEQVSASFVKHDPQQIHLAVTVTGPGFVSGGGLSCGDGAGSICDVAVAPGSSTTLTAAADPQARFLGWGGACSGAAATCPVTSTADAQVTALFEFEMDTLVANDGTNIPVLAINSTKAFFGRRTSDGAQSIWSVPKTGGTPTFVAPGVPAFLVADDGFVYWTDGFLVYSAPANGGPASQIASSASAGRLALDGDGALYWVDVRGTGRQGSVHRLQHRIETVLASGQDPTGGIAVDGTDVYFTNASAAGDGKSVRRVPKTGGTAVPVVETTVEAEAVRVDPQNIYFRDATGAVFSVPKAGGTPQLLSGPNAASGAAIGPLDVDVNASVVWWTWMDASSGPSKGLFRADADGKNFAAADTGSDLSVWAGPRVDDTAVFYFHAGALLKRLK